MRHLPCRQRNNPGLWCRRQPSPVYGPAKHQPQAAESRRSDQQTPETVACNVPRSGLTVKFREWSHLERLTTAHLYQAQLY